jgi:hypothetical protein
VSKSFRGEDSNGYPDLSSLNEYKPPSLLAEHKGIAIVFGILCLALAAYWIKSLGAAHNSPPAPQSVYIEVVPQKVPLTPP